MMAMVRGLLARHRRLMLLFLCLISCLNPASSRRSVSNVFPTRPQGGTTRTRQRTKNPLWHLRAASDVPSPKDKLRTTDKSTSSSTTTTTGDGGATIPASIFNLVNNVAGAGILTLSAGMAGGTGWIPAIVICATLGALSSHTFSLIGASCELTDEVDFKGLWSRTISPRSTAIVDSIVAVMCLACAIIYSSILGDVFTPLLRVVGLPDAYNGRSSNIVFLTVTLLLPMSLVKNLSALAFTSILGFMSILYTVVFVCIRALDGTYDAARSGKFLLDGLIQDQPSFARESLWNLDFTSLILASNLGLSYIAHYNGPAFYSELQNASTHGRFYKMVTCAFVILTLLYMVTMAAGYATFGDATKGNLLLNYHPNDDVLSTCARLATGCSILFGFPLVARGARESIASAAKTTMDLMQNGNNDQRKRTRRRTGGGVSNGNDDDGNHVWLVVAMLTVVTYVACTVEDVSLVVGLTGAIMGSFIVYICPAIIYTRAVALVKGRDSADYNRAKMNLALVPFGLVIAALGVYVTLTDGGGG